MGCRVDKCHGWAITSLCFEHWLASKGYNQEWKDRVAKMNLNGYTLWASLINLFFGGNNAK